ncbi:MAG: transglutaminase-like domain-containing protein [Planctomycetota bacterium]
MPTPRPRPTALAALAFALLIAMPTLAANPADPAPAPPGAAALWAEPHPAYTQARDLLDQGRFADAEAMLAADATLDAQARADALDVIRRLRREFSQSAERLTERIAAQVDGFTAEELTQLTEQGLVVHRVIDGQVGYFRREPGVLFRFNDDIKQRREATRLARATDSPNKNLDEDRSNRTLNDHLADVVAQGLAAHAAGQPPLVTPTRFRFDYTLTVKPAAEQHDPSLMKPGSTLRVWLPFPQPYRQQSDIALTHAAIDGQPYDPYLAPPAANFDGPGPITGTLQRTAYFEHTVADSAEPVRFDLSFEYTVAGHYPVIDREKVRPLTAEEQSAFAPYLAERPPHLLFTPELRALVDDIIGDATHPWDKAQRLWDWWDANIRWLPEFEYATIPSFTQFCLDRRRGDCGVQAVTFMAMLRLAGIPARWQSGFITFPGSKNLHDWAEMYLPPYGWVVVDPSFGKRTSDDPNVRDFYLGHMDAYRLIVNLDYGQPLDPPKPSLRSEPADFQRGEVELDGTNLYFDDWSYRFTPTVIE